MRSALARMLVLVFASVALAAPASAAAATVANVDGATLHVQSGAEANAITLDPSGTDTLVADPAGVTSDGTCEELSLTAVRCPRAPGPQLLQLEAGAGDDEVRITGFHQGPVDGGPGNDLLSGGSGPDQLAGGEGADRLLGNVDFDSLDGGPGADVLDGGQGGDTIDYSNHSVPVLVVADGVANDGAAGEGDNVVPEANPSTIQADSIRGGSAGDFLVGDAGANRVYGGAGNDAVFGLGGVDWLFGEDGDDYLAGGDSPDLLHGGAGADTLRGEAGDDDLHANIGLEDRDGAADDVSGGPGVDVYNVIQPADEDECRIELPLGCVTTTPTLISFDNVANDNAESDNVRSDVEGVISNEGRDVFFGSAAKNGILTKGGADRINPGTGGDLVWSGPEDDIIDTRDGEIDGADCGSGADQLFADTLDFHKNCETVDLPAGSSGRALDPSVAARIRDRLRAPAKAQALRASTW